jgi:anti-anti-sigma factor
MTATEKPGEGLVVSLSREDGFVVVSGEGEIDFPNGPVLSDRLTAALGERPPRIVVDLHDVTFVDSTGLALLVAAHRDARANQGWLRLAGPRGQLRRLLEITNLDRWLPPYPSVEAAATGQAEQTDGR